MLCSLVLLPCAGGFVLAAAAPTPAGRTIVLVRHGSYVPDPEIDEKIGPQRWKCRSAMPASPYPACSPMAA